VFVSSLQLKNFRNYSNLSIPIEKKINFLLGPNGCGKSNLLEAIGIFSQFKSFRSVNDNDLVLSGEDNYFIKLWFLKNNNKHNIQIGYQMPVDAYPRKKKILYNEKVIHSASNIIGEFICIFFIPDDLAIIDGGMKKRRQFFDLILSQCDFTYLQNLVEYNRALKQRNALLRSINERKMKIRDLNVWNEQLISRAGDIITKREQLIQNFNPLLQNALSKISCEKDYWEIKYIKKTEKEKLQCELEKSTQKDIIHGRTSAGPHLDKIFFKGYPNGKINSQNSKKDVLDIASQGQKRTLVLSLKIAQYEYYRSLLGINPVLLIDDVITELDKSRKIHFIELLGTSGQSFFTTTSLDDHKEICGEFFTDFGIFNIPDILNNEEN
jgi:DNA replication and repair protein RecF